MGKASSPDIEIIATSSRTPTASKTVGKPSPNKPPVNSNKNSTSSVTTNCVEKIAMFIDEEDTELVTFDCDSCWFTTRDSKELTNHLIDKHGFSVEAAKVNILLRSTVTPRYRMSRYVYDFSQIRRKLGVNIFST